MRWLKERIFGQKSNQAYPFIDVQRLQVDAAEAAQLRGLARDLGMTFSNLVLLKKALIHKSYAHEGSEPKLPDNERLEFLGDAVLDLIITHEIMRRFPTLTEGEMSKHRSSMVNEKALHKIAEKFQLGRYLYLGKGEKLSGGAEKPSLLANTYEAIIGAFYLDAGLAETFAVLRTHFADYFNQLQAGDLQTDYKTAVQEWAHSHLKASPRYRLVSADGPDHEKIFEVSLVIDQKIYGTGRGRSKKEAEQRAAEGALAQLKAAKN